MEYEKCLYGISVRVGHLIALKIELVNKATIQGTESVAGSVDEKIFKSSGSGTFTLDQPAGSEKLLRQGRNLMWMQAVSWTTDEEKLCASAEGTFYILDMK